MTREAQKNVVSRDEVKCSEYDVPESVQERLTADEVCVESLLGIYQRRK